MTPLSKKDKALKSIIEEKIMGKDFILAANFDKLKSNPNYIDENYCEIQEP